MMVFGWCEVNALSLVFRCAKHWLYGAKDSGKTSCTQLLCHGDIQLKTTPHSSGALAGVRILDMATVLAAPFGATLCADHGADVVKLELPDGSDTLRALQPV